MALPFTPHPKHLNAGECLPRVPDDYEFQRYLDTTQRDARSTSRFSTEDDYWTHGKLTGIRIYWSIEWGDVTSENPSGVYFNTRTTRMRG